MKRFLIVTGIAVAALIVLAGVTKFLVNKHEKSFSPEENISFKQDNLNIHVFYNRPYKKNRSIFGQLVPYGEVWRTGANETTTIEFSEDVTLEGKTVPKGKYALFTIPNEKEWTVILNKGIKWGAYSYKEDEDVIRVNVPVKKSKEFNERMKFDISESGNVALFWENAQVDFKVK